MFNKGVQSNEPRVDRHDVSRISTKDISLDRSSLQRSTEIAAEFQERMKARESRKSATRCQEYELVCRNAPDKITQNIVTNFRSTGSLDTRDGDFRNLNELSGILQVLDQAKETMNVETTLMSVKTETVQFNTRESLSPSSFSAALLPEIEVLNQNSELEHWEFEFIDGDGTELRLELHRQFDGLWKAHLIFDGSNQNHSDYLHEVESNLDVVEISTSLATGAS